MKKTFIIIALLSFCTVGAHSQTLAEKLKSGVKRTIKLIDQDAHPTGTHKPWDLFVAPKLGLAVSNLTTMDGKMKPGIMFGGYIEVFFVPNIGVDMEVTYNRQGANDVPWRNSEGVYKEHDIYIDCLNSTYLCRWYPKEEIPLSVYSGLHMSRIVNARLRTKGSDSHSIKDDLHKGDVAIPIGVSYEWKQWQADLRYNFYFRHIASSQEAKRVLDNACNSMLSLTVAYRIQLW